MSRDVEDEKVSVELESLVKWNSIEYTYSDLESLIFFVQYN